MELTQSQISEIISNYTSSSKGFITLQSLIMNSLMGHERDLFVKANEHKQCNGLRSRRWYSHDFEFSLRIPRSAVVIKKSSVLLKINLKKSHTILPKRK